MPEWKKSVSQKLRLPNKDYSRAGWYFVTLSADYHRHLFGSVKRGVMTPNALGELVKRHWEALPSHYPHIRLGMPQQIPVRWSAALAEGRALWLSAYPDEICEATRATCLECNEWARMLAGE